MADVKLDWGNPPDTSDIDSIRLFRLTDDTHSAYNSNLESTNDLDLVNSFVTSSEQVYEELNPAANSSGTFTDTGLDSGTYTYGAFSHNAGGYGPGTVVTVYV